MHGANLQINGGYFNAKDNAVIGGNGIEGLGDTNIEINGGWFEGEIQTPGYIGCGIYHPQSGNLTINSGTFLIYGVGILMRGGTATLASDKNILIRTRTDGSGKVGDSPVIINSNDICVDLKSNYYDANNISVIVNNNKCLCDTVLPQSNTSLEVLSDNSNDHTRICVIQGRFRPPIDDIFVDSNSVNTIKSNTSIVTVT